MERPRTALWATWGAKCSNGRLAARTVAGVEKKWQACRRGGGPTVDGAECSMETLVGWQCRCGGGLCRRWLWAHSTEEGCR